MSDKASNIPLAGTYPSNGRQEVEEKPQETRRHSRALWRGRAVVSLGVSLLLIFGIITALVLFLNPVSFDLPITRAVQTLNFGPANWLLEAVSAPGFAPYSFIFPLAGIALVAIVRRFVEAAFLGVATIATGASSIVKALVHRGRPSASLVHVIGHPESYSFPSGHVTEYTLFFGFCFYLVFTLMKPGLIRTLLLVFTGGLVVLVGPSRIWMGAHWASDVLGGYTLGMGLLLLVIWGYRTWEARRVKHEV